MRLFQTLFFQDLEKMKSLNNSREILYNSVFRTNQIYKNNHQLILPLWILAAVAAETSNSKCSKRDILQR